MHLERRQQQHRLDDGDEWRSDSGTAACPTAFLPTRAVGAHRHLDHCRPDVHRDPGRRRRRARSRFLRDAVSTVGGRHGFATVTTTTGCTWTAVEQRQLDHVERHWRNRATDQCRLQRCCQQGSARSGSLTIARQTFTVKQAAAACAVLVDGDRPRPSAPQAATRRRPFRRPRGARGPPSATQRWLAVESGASGSGTGVVTLSANPNTDAGSQRNRHHRRPDLHGDAKRRAVHVHGFSHDAVSTVGGHQRIRDGDDDNWLRVDGDVEQGLDHVGCHWRNRERIRVLSALLPTRVRRAAAP